MPDPLAGLPPRFLRTPEAARLLGLSGRTLEKHRTYGTGPKYRKIGGRVVYALDDLKAWADLGAKTSTSGSWCCNGLPGETERGSKPTRDAVASPLTMEHDRRRRVESRTGGAQSARALAGKGAARWISATALNEHQPLNGALTRLQAPSATRSGLPSPGGAGRSPGSTNGDS